MYEYEGRLFMKDPNFIEDEGDLITYKACPDCLKLGSIYLSGSMETIEGDTSYMEVSEVCGFNIISDGRNQLSYLECTDCLCTERILSLDREEGRP